MKQCYVFLWLALVPLFLCAQNWQPILPGNFYHYQPEGDSLVITLWVDSTAVESGDSVFYLNRRVAEARDTVGGLGPLYRLNQPFFLMKQLRRLGPGQYRCEDSATLQLDARAALGASQPFDTARGLSLTLEARYDSVVFGQLDSVLRFRLNDGQRLLWSQSHGLLRFPALAPDSAAWELIGIAGADSAGVQVPTFSDFFAWQVGDVMEYAYRRGNAFADNFFRTKLTLIEELPLSSGKQFRAERVYRWRIKENFRGPRITQSNRDTVTLTFTDSLNHPVNQFSYQPFSYRLAHWQAASLPDSLLSWVKVFRHSDGSWSRRVGENGFMLFDTMGLAMEPVTVAPVGIEVYQSGVGLTEGQYTDQLSDANSDSALVAYRTATDSMGTLTPDSVLLAPVDTNRVGFSHAVALEKTLTVFPNPFFQTLTLRWDTQALGLEAVFLLQNVHGQTLLRQRLSGPDASWQLPELPSGIYYLRVEGLSSGVKLRRRP